MTPGTPYLGAQYRPRMFAPSVAEPSRMAPPQYGRLPQAQMFAPPVTLPNIGGGSGNIYGGGGSGNGGSYPAPTPSQGGGYAGGNNDDGAMQGSEWSYNSFDDFAKANGLNFGNAGSGGMLDRLNNMMSYTPGGMLSTALGKPLASLAPFKTPSIGTGYSTNVGGSMLAPIAPSGPAMPVPKVQTQDLGTDEWSQSIADLLGRTPAMAGVTDYRAPQDNLGGMSSNTYLQSLMDREGGYDEGAANGYLANLMGDEQQSYSSEDFPGLGYYDDNGDWIYL